MFRAKKELKGLVRASRKALLEAESKIENRNRLIKNQQEENLVLYEENKNLRRDIENMKDFIKDVEFLTTSTTYSNDRARLGIIKELAQDFLTMC